MNISDFDAPIALVWLGFGVGGAALVNIGFQAFYQSRAAIRPQRKPRGISPRNVPNPMACSLSVRQAQTAEGCCLFQSHAGNPLLGGARTARQLRLKRLGMLL